MSDTTISELFLAWIKPLIAPLPELPDGMQYDEKTMMPAIKCYVCDNWYVWDGDVDEYNHDDYMTNRCGGSPRCCP
jgi:hypothetical protein